MPFFAYRGRNARGDLVEGVLEGADTGSIADQLFNSGVTPLDISAARAPAATSERLQWKRLREPPIRALDVQLFSRQMYTLLKSGVPIMRGLAGLQESAVNPTFAAVLRDLRESLDGGRELSAAMRRHPRVFSAFYVSMVRVGEMTGRLDEIFLRLFQHLEFEREMRERVKSALRYPLFVIVVMLIALIVINMFVVPTFAKVYDGLDTQLPLMTRLLMASSAFTVQYWPILLMAAVGAIVGFLFYTRQEAGRYRWDRFKLRLPIFGKIVTKATLSRFARSFALAMRSGIPVVQGMSIVAEVVDNAFVGQRIEQMKDGVERGESILRTAVASGVFTPVVLQMVAVGEETGQLDDLMSEIADMYEREVDYELKTLSSQIEPVLIVGLGALVLVLALGVFLPMWDLGSAVMK